VDGIVLKAAWHWDSDSSVGNDTLGEQVRTSVYVGVCPRGAPLTVNIFPVFRGRAPYLGTPTDMNEWMNE
jgi:hypothetical protein